MSTLIFICLLGVFAYHCTAVAQWLNGSSNLFKVIIGLCGNVGYIIYFGTLIWSLWPFEWWQSLIVFVAQFIIGGGSAFVFQNKENIVCLLINPIAVVVFSVLSIIGLL